MGIDIQGNETAKAIKKLDALMHKSYISRYRVEVSCYRPFQIKFDILNDRGNGMAGFQLIEQINCCGILVSTKTYVRKEFRGDGYAQEMMKFKEALALEFGYTLLLCTVDIGNNPAEVHILEKCGWTKDKEFLNARTKHTIGVFSKDLRSEE